MNEKYLIIQSVTDEFCASERTLQRDFHQRLGYLDIIQDNGCYRLSSDLHPDLLPVTLSFIRNTGIARSIPADDRELMNLLMGSSDLSPCFIWHSPPKTSRCAIAASRHTSLMVRQTSAQ
ncbi:hypothetical protein [Kluyvera sp. CHPC 1.251]|uniref:hypothetical protein n=1 Tax=Kluyvera sp. CHPC 1.251 TaxID=2995175 RepID=UPI002FD7A9B9